MHPPLRYTLEAHATAATLYLHGTLAPHSAVTAFRACYTLPRGVRRLHVDLRGVHDASAGTAGTLAILLEGWRRARRGRTQVALRGGGARRAS
jgi:ABC-type transporter Mla MlaB component